MITSLSYQDSDSVGMGLREGDLAAPAALPGLDLPMANQVLIVVPSIITCTGMAKCRKPGRSCHRRGHSTHRLPHALRPML
ncbi:MAG: hypothetical protein ABI980_05065 [Nitrospirota bacterium]